MYGNEQYSHSQYAQYRAGEERQPREQDTGGDERGVTPREAYGSGVALATREDVAQGRAEFLSGLFVGLNKSTSATLTPSLYCLGSSLVQGARYCRSENGRGGGPTAL